MRIDLPQILELKLVLIKAEFPGLPGFKVTFTGRSRGLQSEDLQWISMSVDLRYASSYRCGRVHMKMTREWWNETICVCDLHSPVHSRVRLLNCCGQTAAERRHRHADIRLFDTGQHGTAIQQTKVPNLTTSDLTWPMTRPTCAISDSQLVSRTLYVLCLKRHRV